MKRRNTGELRRSQIGLFIGAGVVLGWACFGILALTDPLLVLAIPAALVFLICVFRPNLGIYVLMALLFFAPVTVNLGWSGQTTTYVFFAAAALALGGRLARFFTKAQRVGEQFWIMWLLVPVALLGVIHGTALADWWVDARSLMVLVVVAWHVSAEAKLDPERMRRVAIMIVWAAPALAVVALHQRAVGFWPFFDQYASSASYTSRGDPSRSASIMGHPILYGSYCMVASVVAAALKPKNWKLLLGAALIGLILSGARSAWIGAGVALFLLVLVYRPRISFWGMYSGLIILCIVLVAFIVAPDLSAKFVEIATGRVDNLAGSQSSLARQLRGNIAWSQIDATDETWWWGLGPGALVAYFARSSIGDNLAATFDNSYLTLWYEYGIITLAAFSLVMVAAILRGGAPAGRVLMVAIAAQVVFFDMYQWPLMMGAVALAAGLRIKPAAAPLSRDVEGFPSVAAVHRDVADSRGWKTRRTSVLSGAV